MESPGTPSCGRWGNRNKKMEKEAMYIATVENTCDIQKGRDLNPVWLPLLRHFSWAVFLVPERGLRGGCFFVVP